MWRPKWFFILHFMLLLHILNINRYLCMYIYVYYYYLEKVTETKATDY